MSLVDTLNQTITAVGQAWDNAGPFRILIALVVPVVAWLVRKPLANLLFKLFSAVGKGLGFEVGDKVAESTLPAI